jgi:hypothetical protein
MSLALERVLRRFKPKGVEDAATRLIAENIIEPAQRGVRDGATLISMALKEFKHDD